MAPDSETHDTTPQAIYQIKVTLLGMKPAVWRRVLVPADFTLAQLHQIVQLAIGWEDSHLHEFRIAGRTFGVPHPDDRFMGRRATVDERRARLADVLSEGSKAEYSYDFGDDWLHRLLVEKVLAPEPGVEYPICTAGKRNGPPEDCGGAGGYDTLLEALEDPYTEEHQDKLEWIGGDFDPEAFSVDEVNQKLAIFVRRTKKSAVRKSPKKALKRGATGPSA